MDQDLQEIRNRRLAELSAAQTGNIQNSPVSFPGASEEQDAKSQKNEEARDRILIQILENDARQRLQRISLVKPEKARAIEDRLIALAQSGRLRGLVSEQALIQFLNQINQDSGNSTHERTENKSGPKIVYSRRRFDDSDEEEDYGL